MVPTEKLKEFSVRADSSTVTETPVSDTTTGALICVAPTNAFTVTCPPVKL